ncbi:uncharacterized protein LOC141882052 [Acropora palmata]|uniref:uncharacterized protein LOC141882052 n=1 Tax=Acropora palmata TaxID=6131 RepID=UPI003DA11325
MADRDRLSRALSEAVSRAVSDALDSALPQTCNRVSPNENGSRSQGNTVIPAVANAPSTNQQITLFTKLQAMGAKFYICLLLVILVTSPVYSTRLRWPQDTKKSPLFLYGKRYQDDVRSVGTCCDTCGTGYVGYVSVHVQSGQVVTHHALVVRRVAVSHLKQMPEE